MLSDALLSSPIVVGEDGTGAVPGGMGGFDFGVDPNEDPELALVSRNLIKWIAYWPPFEVVPIDRDANLPRNSKKPAFFAPKYRLSFFR